MTDQEMTASEKFANNLLVLLDQAREVNESCSKDGTVIVEAKDIDSMRNFLESAHPESALQNFVKEIEVSLVWIPIMQKTSASVLDGCRQLKNGNFYGKCVQLIAQLLERKNEAGEPVVDEKMRNEFWRGLTAVLKCCIRYMLLEPEWASREVGYNDHAVEIMACAFEVPLQPRKRGWLANSS